MSPNENIYLSKILVWGKIKKGLKKQIIIPVGISNIQ